MTNPKSKNYKTSVKTFDSGLGGEGGGVAGAGLAGFNGAAIDRVLSCHQESPSRDLGHVGTYHEQKPNSAAQVAVVT